MSCQNYRVLEMQNNNIGIVAVDSYMPFGNITRRISKTTGGGIPFEVSSSGADTISITNKGYYKVNYNGSLKVGAAGAITLTLYVNGNEVAKSTTTASGEGTFNVNLVKVIRVFANCEANSTNCPANLQIQLTGTGVTGGNSVIIVDSCVNG